MTDDSRPMRKMASVHCAGTSCTAFASIGKQLGVRDATILPFLSWVCQRIILQEPLILHENSKNFPVQLLQRFLGHLYEIDSGDTDAMVYGAPVRRERKLTRMYHRGKTGRGSHLSFLDFSLQFERRCLMTWRSFFFLHTIKEDWAKDAAHECSMQCVKSHIHVCNVSSKHIHS